MLAVKAEHSHQYSITFCCRVTDGSKGAVWQNGIWHGSAYKSKVCCWIPPCGKSCNTDIHWCLLNIYGDQTVELSTVRHVSAVVTATRKASRILDRCTGVTPWNEECLYQLTHANQITVVTTLQNNYCTWEFALSNNITVLFVSVVGSMEINRRHYFQSKLCNYNSSLENHSKKGTIAYYCSFNWKKKYLCLLVAWNHFNLFFQYWVIQITKAILPHIETWPP